MGILGRFLLQSNKREPLGSKRRINYCHILWKKTGTMNRRTKYAVCRNPFCFHLFKINEIGSTRFYCNNTCSLFMQHKKWRTGKFRNQPQIKLTLERLGIDRLI